MSAGSSPRATEPGSGAYSAIQPLDEPARVRTAILRTQALAAILRAYDPDAVERFFDRLTRDEIRAIATAAAAMLPTRFDPAGRLAWVQRDPTTWSDRLLTHETARYDAGDRDATARMAYAESERRLAEMQQGRAS